MLWKNPNVKFIGFDEPITGTAWGMWGNVLKWRGHHGVGDFMYGLNIAYYVAHILQEKIILRIFWDHGRSFYWSHDDHETIFERFDYLHNFFHNYKKLVTVEHVYDYRHINRDFSGELMLNLRNGYPNDAKPLKRGSSNHLTIARELSHWKFSDFAKQKTEKNKVVIWRPFLNANKSARWKLAWTPWDWELIIDSLEKQGYNIHEVDYRTPVREVMYAISRCEFVIAYDGMWQYVTRNLGKPSIMLGDNSIINTHNPQAVTFFSRKKDLRTKTPPFDKAHLFIRKLKKENIKILIDKSEEYNNKISRIIDNEN